MKQLKLSFLLIFFFLSAKADVEKVLRIELKASIDPRTNRLIELALAEAESEEIDAVIIEMDTYGGAVTDANDIRNAILEFEKPLHVYINTKAISAGALISIACDSIYMAPGANIGAATVVTQDGAAAPDKYQSFMRSIMRSTAETKGRDPKIAEAMVDENIDLDSVSPEGTILTFTVDEALENGYCEAKVKDIEEILELNSWEDAEVIDYDPGATEGIISLFLNPAVSGILILIIVGGIYFELQTPGVGFPILASIIAAILYFIPYYLTGLAENWEIIAFMVGVVLIALEVFVIPGFGIAGILGLILTIGGLLLVMLNNDFFDFTFVPDGQIMTSLISILAGMFGAIIIMFIAGVRLTRSDFFKRVALETSFEKDAGYSSNFNKESLKGKEGIAHTILRPSGKIEIEDEIYDAYSRGEHIDKGEKVIVISEEGTSLKVKKVS